MSSTFSEVWWVLSFESRKTLKPPRIKRLIVHTSSKLMTKAMGTITCLNLFAGDIFGCPIMFEHVSKRMAIVVKSNGVKKVSC